MHAKTNYWYLIFMFCQAVHWSPNASMLAVGSDEGTAKVFVYQNNQMKVHQGHSSHKNLSKEVLDFS